MPSDECTRDFLELFFINGHYNSCDATDELLKRIEKSQDEDLAKKALLLYQKYYSKFDRPWDNVTFMYGLGLIYMHFNAYNWATKAFREAIYIEPNFAKSKDVHTRLGLIFKATKLYQSSEKHFKLAINDTRPKSGTSTRLELEFHLAHLYEIQGKHKQAKEAYERLLQEKDLPHQLSANIYRQLGWLYFYNDTTDPSTNSKNRKQNVFNQQQKNTISNGRLDAALNYLNTSYRTDSDPKTSYYLGRCFTNIGKFQDAFASYRSVIDREESTADTWCSIGVLYHRQNQPTDALQAYIRAVQFDKQHSVAWMNLGILYESHKQFSDALKCYQHVICSTSNGSIDGALQARIKFIQKQINENETSNNGNKSKINSDKLLSLEDLWNLESKTSLEAQSSTSSNNNNNNIDKHSPSVSNTTNSSIIINNSQVNNILIQPIENSATTIITNEQSNRPNNTENKPTVENNNNNTINDFDMKTPTNTSLLNNCANKTETLVDDFDSKLKNIKSERITHSRSTSVEANHIGSYKNDCKLQTTSIGSQDLNQNSLDFKDISPTLGSTYGASKDSGISSNSSNYADCALVPSQNTNISSMMNQIISAEQVIEACRNSPKPKKIDINLLTDESKPPHMFIKPPPYPPVPPDKLFPSTPSIYLETKKDLATKSLQDFCQSSPISIVRNISSVLKLDLGYFSTKTLVECNPDQEIQVLSHTSQMNENQINNHNIKKQQWTCQRQLSNSTISRYASYQIASFKEFSQEERDNKSSGSNKNTSINLSKESDHGSFELGSAQQTKRLNNNNSQSTSQLNNDNNNTNVTNQNSQSSNSGNVENNDGSPSCKKFKKEQQQPQKLAHVKSAVGIDLSDEKKWRLQLNELNKLPNFVKCVSASNMLTHVGTLTSGINAIVMDMHVPGCKILGNRALSNNLCSVYINIGPGDYEWSAVSAEYVSIISKLCKRNGFELHDNDWWPKMSDLQKHNIPIFRFSQRPGDLVWINTGTFYWVQATGWCNSIYWNVGPLCVKQFKSASEINELNKFLLKKPDVPMVQMTWNIIMNIHIITDDDLYHLIIDILRRSLQYCTIIKDLIEESKQEIQNLNYIDNDNEEDNGSDISPSPGPKSAKFCSLCESEIFNFHFIKKQDGSSIHCIECARRFDSTFIEYDIKQEYELKYLMKLYDNFIETRRKFQRQQQLRSEQL